MPHLQPMMLVLLGVLLGFVASIVANLITPFVDPLWSTLLSLQRRGYHAQTRQQIKVLQTQLDQLNARQAAPDRDVYLELFQWSLGIFSVFSAGVACAFLGMASSGTSDGARVNLLNVALVFFIGAVISSLVILSYSRDLTSEGAFKRTAKLETDIAKLRAKLQ